MCSNSSEYHSIRDFGYSNTITNDIVMLGRGVSSFATQLDISTLVLLAVMERLEKQWRELLGSVGLEIAIIWKSRENGWESVIEAVLA